MTGPIPILTRAEFLIRWWYCCPQHWTLWYRGDAIGGLILAADETPEWSPILTRSIGAK